MIKPKFNNSGFILLFAVLMVSIVLTVTLVLLDITLRQLVLSATNRDSQVAYYAAYAGIDCAIFWDRDNPSDTAKPFGSYEGTSILPDDNSNITCGAFFDQPPNTPTFSISFGGEACAQITITKQPPDPGDGTGDTIITSNGYSQGGASCNSTSNRNVERRLVTTYNDNWK